MERTIHCRDGGFMKQKLRIFVMKKKLMQFKIVRVITQIYSIFTCIIYKIKFRKTIAHGAQLIDGLSKQTLKDRVYIVCTAALGDTAIVASYVKAFKNLINNPVVLVIRKSHESLVELYKKKGVVENIILVTKSEMEDLRLYLRFVSKDKYPNILHGHFKHEYFTPFKNDGNSLYMDFRTIVLGINDASIPEGVYDIACEEEAIINVEENSILIIPYANTVKLRSRTFFERLARSLILEGYNVYTNLGGDFEQALPGTTPYNVPVSELIRNCTKFKHIISLRSGMCDILALTECKLIVVNSSEFDLIKWNVLDYNERPGITNVLFEEDEKTLLKIHSLLE